MPQVSVIIPVYNVEKYLRQCLDSVINQTLEDIEIICVNDGSTDNSLQILEEYALKDNRIYIINQKNRGVSVARNNGIKKAHGEYICFIDPDDIYPTDDILEVLYNTAINNKVLICGGEFSDFSNNEKPYVLKQNFDSSVKGYIFSKDGLIQYKDYQFDYGFTRFLYHKAFLLKNNIKFPKLMQFEDPPFFVKAMLCAREFYGIHKITYGYRCNHKITIFDKKRTLDLLKGAKENLKYAKKYKYNQLSNTTCIRLEQFYNSYKDSLDWKCLWLLNTMQKYNSKIEDFIIKNNLMFKDYIFNEIFKILQKLFSIRKEYSNNKKHNVITILGIKIKFKKSSNKKSQKNYKKVLKNLEKEVKLRNLRVCFLVNETAKWNAQSLYDEMKKSDIFEPFVIVTNLQNLTGRPSYSHLLEFYKSCVDNVQIGWDENTKQGIDLKMFRPDIVFYQQPWDLYDNQNVEYASNFALTCHFSYAMSDAASCIEAHYHDFYSILYKYFVFSDAEKEEYKNKMKDNCKNVLVLGHPKLDVYKDYDEHKYENKYVIYAPHHSLEEDSLNYATFMWNGEYILNWAKQHPEFDWVFKPHPRLKQALIFNSIMSEEEVENYYSEWAKIGLYYNDGNYFDLFKNSKCLITDCGSFLIEYLPTCKPVIHLRNPKGIDYIPSCRIAMEAYYKAWNVDELNKYLDEILIKNNDYMKNVRIEIQKNLKLQDFNSTKKIINFLKESIGKNK